eukprot:1936646-Amphidinium_carterae.1
MAVGIKDALRAAETWAERLSGRCALCPTCPPGRSAFNLFCEVLGARFGGVHTRCQRGAFVGGACICSSPSTSVAVWPYCVARLYRRTSGITDSEPSSSLLESIKAPNAFPRCIKLASLPCQHWPTPSRPVRLTKLSSLSLSHRRSSEHMPVMARNVN